MNKDISTDANAREELVDKYGRMATPTLVIGDKMFLGFRRNRAEIEKTLSELSEENHD